MKALLPLIAIVWMTVPAQAVTFNCEGVAPSQGSVVLVCDDSTCSASGAIERPTLRENNIPIANCQGHRRSESAAKRYQTLAYYDVADTNCWASYIRVAKQFEQDGSIFASLVNARGPEVMDDSGYDYVQLRCEIQK